MELNLLAAGLWQVPHVRGCLGGGLQGGAIPRLVRVDVLSAVAS